jgi:hypothetical protein
MARRTGNALRIEDLEGRTLLSSVTYSLTTDQSVYQLGQPVQITYTETNNSDQPVSVLAPNDFLELWHNGAELILVPPPDSSNPANTTTLAAGQSITEHDTWNGLWPFETFTLGDITGTFTVAITSLTAPPGPGDPTANFQIVPPPAGAIVSSITADQTAATPDGLSYTLTFTETNDGDEPVSVPTGPNGFGVVPGPNYDGTPFIGLVPQASWTTLQPGQSWTQTSSMVYNSAASPDPEFVTNIYDLNGNTVSMPETVTSQEPGIQPPGSNDSSNQGAAVPVGAPAMVTTGRATYHLGRGVRITLTIPGSGPEKVALPRIKTREQITVLHGAQVVSRLIRNVPTSTLKHLEAGRKVKLTKLWNGRSNQPGIERLTPGAYTIDVAFGDYDGSTTVKIGRKDS